jgi:WD40 repeat protein
MRGIPMRVRTALLLAAMSSAAIFAGPPPADPILVLDAGFHTAMINRISASEDGARFLSSSDDKTARLYDGEGRLIRVLRVPIAPGNEGKLYACALSPDGAMAALAGSTGYRFESAYTVYLFDTASGAMIRRLKGFPGVIHHLAFAPSAAGRPMLACSLGDKKGIRVLDPNTGAEIFKDAPYGEDSYWCDFSPDGSFLGAIDYNGSLRAYPRSGSGFGSALKADCMGGKKPFSLAFCATGSKLLVAVGFDEALAVDVYELSAASLSYAFSPDFSGLSGGNVSSVAFSKADEPCLIAGGTYKRNGERYAVAWEKAGRGARQEYNLGFHNSIMEFCGLRDGGFLIADSAPTLIRAGADFKVRFALQPPIADYRNNYSWDGFRLSEDGMTFDFSYRSYGKEPASFSLASRSLSAPAALAAQDTKSLQVADWRNSQHPKLDGKALTLEAYEDSISLATAPDRKGFLLGADWHVYRFSSEGKLAWKISVPETPWAVAVSGNGLLAAVAYGDGTIRWYRYDTGAELLAFYPHPDKTRWAAWTPSGYYMASPGAEDFLGWHLNKGMDAAPDFYPISRFRSAYYRPDVVALVLQTLDEKAALAQADAAAGRKAQATGVAGRLPPTIAVTSPASGSAFSGDSVRLTYRVRSPSDAPVTKVRVLVDGRPLEGGKGLAVAPANDRDIPLDVAVPPKSCMVSLIADNKNGSSEAATVQLIRQASEEFVIKPKLYVLAVGVSAYSNPDFRLKYAAKDARDLAAALEMQKGGIYREVTAKVLTDASATKDDILDGLEWIQKETTSKDVALMYFSGHGLNDASNNYYYLPVEADLDRLKRTGVPFSDITTTVSSISGKVLFFIDTCHSGNLMKGRKSVGTERDVAAVINELSSSENGAVVFASSTGNQYSFEDPAWNNGAFTKALIEGLTGKAAYGSGDRVTVNMLDLYLSERVKELTGGKQTPTTTKPANVPDFPVSMKR